MKREKTIVGRTEAVDFPEWNIRGPECQGGYGRADQRVARGGSGRARG